MQLFEGCLSMTDEKDLKRYRLICLLASGASNREASIEMGVSVSTIERLRQGVDFQNELTEAISRVYHSSLMQLTLGMSRAATELRKIIESDSTPDRVRIKAIEVLFSQTANLDNMTIELRLKELEERVRLRDIHQPPYDDGGYNYLHSRTANQLSPVDDSDD